MSRTRKGRKPPGYDYQARRPGNKGQCGGVGPFRKRVTHGKERAQSREMCMRECHDVRNRDCT